MKGNTRKFSLIVCVCLLSSLVLIGWKVWEAGERSVLAYPAGGAHVLPGRIQAEHFDVGREMISYYDRSYGNTGLATYRETHVDFDWTLDNGAGLVVSQMEAGEWLQYTVYVPKDGSYIIKLRVNATSAKGYSVALSENANGQYVSLALDYEVSRGLGWHTLVSQAVPLKQGQQTLRLRYSGLAPVSFNYFEVVPLKYREGIRYATR